MCLMTTVRSFVSVELSDPAREAVAGLQHDLTSAFLPHTVRWTAPQSIHLTLQFLGDVPLERIESIAQALRGACADLAAFSFDLIGLGLFPDHRRPRIVWVGVHEPGGTLAALHKRVGEALTPLGFFPDERSFTPHLTIGRSARSASPRDLAQMGEQVSRLDVGLIERISVDHIALMKSDLRPAGAIYTPQAILPLGGM